MNVFSFLLLFLTFHYVNGKQNIIFIIADDLRPALGCYGDDLAYTPNIDALSQESFTFWNAYAQQALCAPSRNSFLTSRRPDTLHLYDFYSYWRNVAGNFTTLPQYLKERRYFTKSIGKIFHPGISSNFSDDMPYSWSTTPYHPSTEAYKDAPVCTSRGSAESDLICPVVPGLQPGGTLPDIQSLKEATAFLKERAARHQPFFLAVGFHKPHVPLKYPNNYLDFHPLANVTLPPDPWPVLTPSVAWNPWTDLRQRADIASLNITFPYGHIPDEWGRLIRQSYYAAVTYIDDLIGKLLFELRTSSLSDNTVVVLMGDHGWSLGEHGEWSKFSNYEIAVRVPLIIKIPRLTDRAAVVRSSKTPVELLDLFPTVVDICGFPSLPACPPNSKHVPLCTQGSSLIPLIFKTLLTNQSADVRRPAMSQYPRPGMYPTRHPNSDKPRLHEIRYMGYSMRTPQYRYTEWPEWNSSGPQWGSLAGVELYDHTIDPREDINLAHRPQYQHVRSKLSMEMRGRIGAVSIN